MKLNIIKKVALSISVSILCLFCLVPLSRAEQSNNEFTKQIFSVEDLKSLKGSMQTTDVEPVVPAVADTKQISSSSFDVKIPLNEQLNAIFSLEKPYIADLTGREIGKNYNALIAFQIILQ